MKRILFAAALLSALSFGAYAAAPAQVSSQDRGWLAAAHQTNLAEIQSGNLAAKSGHSAAVRAAGRMLAADHTSLDAKLAPVARQLGVKLPDHPNPKQHAEMQTFHAKSGLDFDKVWTHDEADGHVRAIELTEREIQHGSASKVKQLATATLPVLKKHLRTLHKASTEIRGIH